MGIHSKPHRAQLLRMVPPMVVACRRSNQSRMDSSSNNSSHRHQARTSSQPHRLWTVHRPSCPPVARRTRVALLLVARPGVAYWRERLLPRPTTTQEQESILTMEDSNNNSHPNHSTLRHRPPSCMGNRRPPIHTRSRRPPIHTRSKCSNSNTNRSTNHSRRRCSRHNLPAIHLKVPW